MILIALATLFCALYYWYKAFGPNFWEKYDVPYASPHRFFGNLRDAAYMKRAVGDIYGDIYRKFKNCAYVGIYIVTRPAILVRDPETIIDILIKDFPSFHDNDLDMDEKEDPIFANNPFTMKGEKWKMRRALHTPHFTPAKVKSMFPLLEDGGNTMIDYLNRKIAEDRSRKFCIESMELASKFTIYNVASCALGINSRTFDEENSEMREMGRKILEPGVYNGFKHLLTFIMPSISNFLTVHIVPHDVTNKFKRIVRETLTYRQENGINRNDFFEAVSKINGVENSIDDITNHVGGFYLDGFGTNSSALTFMIYEVAKNTNVQKRLRAEVDKVLAQHGKMTSEVLNDMPYLDAIVSESLRMYPPLPQLTKLCTKPYDLPPATKLGAKLPLKIGTPIVIPLLGLHYDEKYFPEPRKFKPERFLGKNKEGITKGSYLPFSDGPRICLGKRFAMAQSKMALATLVSKFTLRVNKKTKTPIEFDSQSILLQAVGGIWIDFTKRTK